MKVTGNVGNSLQNVQNKSTDDVKSEKGAQSNKQDNQTVNLNSAQINLSSKAQQMKKIADIAKNSPDVDAEKVKKFQELIDNGKYNVDAGAVADRVVNEHLMTSFRDE